MSYLKQKNYITLYEEKFTQLANIFIDISTALEKEKDFDVEVCTNILIISSRVNKKNEKVFNEYLSSKLSDMKIW